MKKNLNWLIALVLVTSTLVLTGCGSSGAQTPTVDPVAIYTQVAQTVQAQVTNNAKLTPKATNTPLPTETQAAATTTLRPSSTPFGTQVATVPTSLTPVKTGTTSAALPTAGAASTATLPALGTQPAVTSGDKMQYISQQVADGSSFAQSQGFTMKWVIKNIGTTTWDSTYQVRLYAGPSFDGVNKPLDSTVKPGAQTTISVDMRAPNTVGEYTTVWVITAPDGHNFGSFTLTVKVK